MRSLIVDAANVIGSRPDGWWRDRAGAARRLWEAVAAASLADDEIVLVLEGAARSGVPAGREGKVRTVHASGAGDDTIVEVARTQAADHADVTVVTADRELRKRAEAVGAKNTSPSWLLREIGAHGGESR
jgi:hypothetical protein